MARKKTLGGGSVAEQRERIGPKVSADVARKRIQELTQDIRTRGSKIGNSGRGRKAPSGNKR